MVASMDALYAIGPKTAPGSSATKPAATNGGAAPAQGGAAAALLVTPTDVILKPGQALPLTVRAFDAMGKPAADAGAITWTVENLKGAVANGTFTPDAAAGAQALVGQLDDAADLAAAAANEDRVGIGQVLPRVGRAAEHGHEVRHAEPLGVGDDQLVILRVHFDGIHRAAGGDLRRFDRHGA